MYKTGLLGGSVVKNLPANAEDIGDSGSILVGHNRAHKIDNI